MSNDWNQDSNDGNEPGAARLLGEMLQQERRRRAWDLRFRIIKYAVVIAALVFIARGFTEISRHAPVGAYFEAASVSKNYGTAEPAHGHAALVRLNGLVGYDNQALAENVTHSLNEAFSNRDTQVVILSIDSPGGSPVQAGQIYEEIVNLRQRYPDIKLHSVINDLGTSGAYYVAAASDQIFADRASIVGSIGVISSGFGYSKLIKRIGVERRIYSAGKNKAALDAFIPEKLIEREAWEQLLNQIHEQFVERVRAGRKGRLRDSGTNLFDGAVWSGEDAFKLGLIDGFHSVGSLARKLNLEVVDFTWGGSLLSQLVRELGFSLRASIAEMLLNSGIRPAAVAL